MKTIIHVFYGFLSKASNIPSECLVYKLRLLTARIYPNFARIDQCLHDLKPKQIFSLTGRQNFNICMAIKLTMVPKWKRNISNEKKFIKIWAFFQKISWNEKVACTKIREKYLLKKIWKNPDQFLKNSLWGLVKNPL